MDLIVIYSGEFGERVIGNLINYSTFCISCADACTHCKEAKYGFAVLSQNSGLEYQRYG